MYYLKASLLSHFYYLPFVLIFMISLILCLITRQPHIAHENKPIYH